MLPDNTDKLHVHRVQDASVIPARRIPNAPMRGGAIDSTGHIIPSSLLRRNYGIIVDAPEDIPAAKRHIAGTCIFGGYLFDHFGHFLLESCARLWHAMHNQSLPVIWSFGKAPLAPFQRDVFRLIRLRNEHVFVDDATSVDHLIVPEPAYVIQTRCHPRFIRMMGKMPVEPHGRNVWLSRSGLPEHLSGIEGEREIEAELARLGWIILHPQLHTLADQVQMIGGAAHVAGFAGSAFHTILLAREVHGRVTIFTRGERISKNFATIAAAKGFDQTIVTPPVEKVEDRGPRSLFRIDDPAFVLDRIAA